MPTKICTQCAREQDVNGFNRSKATLDGRYQWCKACTKAKDQRRRSTPENKAARRFADLDKRNGVIHVRETLHVLSLGAGVQSTTLALMAAAGEITPSISCAVFADTQAEPAAVYRHLDWLERHLPFPVYRVSAGALLTAVLTEDAAIHIPAFIKINGKRSGLLDRHCTSHYKIEPIHKQLRHLTGLRFKQSPATPCVSQWLGISTDEISRVKPSRVTWIEHRYPLIERNMSRSDCLEWMRVRGFPTPPKSACTFCPYHSRADWLSLTPEEMAGAIAVDRSIRERGLGTLKDARFYLHPSCTPLEEAVKLPDVALSAFNMECDGVCGV